jgi:hypothetical protein
MKGYVCSTLGQQGKAHKHALKAGNSANGAQEEDNELPIAERCLMIFRGSQTYESR